MVSLEPTSVELHTTGTFRMIHQLSYRTAAKILYVENINRNNITAEERSSSWKTEVWEILKTNWAWNKNFVEMVTVENLEQNL